MNVPTLSQLIKSKTMLFSVGLAMLSVSQGIKDARAAARLEIK